MGVLKRRRFLKGIVVLLVIIAVSFLANVNSTTKIGINNQVREYNIPLYLKVLNFYDRHFNCQHLVNRVTRDSKKKKEKLISLAAWVNHNIKRLPDDVDFVDNHPWTIIQRRLGNPGQFSDILSVLLSYVGVEAFFRMWNIEATPPFHAGGRYYLTFFRVDDTWSVIDPYQGFYFVDEKGAFASLLDLKEGRWKAIGFGNVSTKGDALFRFYSKLFAKLPSEKEINHTNIYERGGRANIQNPTGRFLYEMHIIWGIS